LWLRVNSDLHTSDFWYIDYEIGQARHSNEGPNGESVLKWKGTILEFFQQREIKINEQTDLLIKFSPQGVS